MSKTSILGRVCVPQNTKKIFEAILAECLLLILVKGAWTFISVINVISLEMGQEILRSPECLFKCKVKERESRT